MKSSKIDLTNRTRHNAKIDIIAGSAISEKIHIYIDHEPNQVDKKNKKQVITLSKEEAKRIKRFLNSVDFLT